jgi:aspartate racemase
MNERRKIVGVLGGMGPDATVDFMARVIAATPAEKDQDHVHMIVDQNPGVPSRQTAILAGGDDPGPAMAEMAVRLENAGADFLVIPCNTAYIFKDAVTRATRIPLLSIIDVTVAACRSFSTVGLLASEGCLVGKQYQRVFSAAGIDVVLQTEEELAGLMRLIFQIKTGDKSDAVSDAMRELASDLVERGAQAVVAACTEIPLVLDESVLDVPLVSSTDVLAYQTVAYARGELPPAEEE